MRPSRKIFLAFASILTISLAGCRQTVFLPAGVAEAPEIRLPMSDTVETMKLKTALQTPRGQFTGITMIKRMPEGKYRIAFFSELGMSYLEGSLEGDYPYQLKVRSVSPFLSSGKTISYLETAFNLYLVRKLDMVTGDVMKDTESRLWMAGKMAGGEIYYGRMDSTGRIDRSFLGDNQHLNAQFEYGEENNARKIMFYDGKEMFLTMTRME